MSAIGLYGPLNHFLYAARIMLVSGSQILYGRYIVRDRDRINSLFSVNLVVLIAAWIPLKRCPRSLEDLMLIPDGFGAAENDRLDITVREIGQVVSVSAQVIDFCRGRGIDGRRAYLAGLFLEEMAGNVVSHGFSKDNKAHSVDIRVVYKNNDIILRIRDNCRAFDPSERAMITEQEDSGKNVGIRIVYGMAREVTYQNLLGMNVLIVSI